MSDSQARFTAGDCTFCVSHVVAGWAHVERGRRYKHDC